MSLYSMLFGENPHSALILALVGLRKSDVGRYRDCYVDNLDGKPVVVVHTRNGGGNRSHDDYFAEGEASVEEGLNCTCTGCVITHVLPAHPLYVSDVDNDFDCTYADVVFRIPDEFHKLDFSNFTRDVLPPERWQQLFDALRSR
jgi:hypothetical protein